MARYAARMPPSEQISLRVAPAVVERADALIEYVTARTGRPATRSAVWREAILAGLRHLERERDEAAKSR